MKIIDMYIASPVPDKQSLAVCDAVYERKEEGFFKEAVSERNQNGNAKYFSLAGQ